MVANRVREHAVSDRAPLRVSACPRRCHVVGNALVVDVRIADPATFRPRILRVGGDVAASGQGQGGGECECGFHCGVSSVGVATGDGCAS